jgi:general secretion pathway protein G
MDTDHHMGAGAFGSGGRARSPIGRLGAEGRAVGVTAVGCCVAGDGAVARGGWVGRGGRSHWLTSKRRAGAFTLIELLVVIAVIGILAGLVLAAMGGVQKQGARARAESDVQALSAAIEEFHRVYGVYPDTDNLYAELTTDEAGGAVVVNTADKVFFEPPPGIVDTNSWQFVDPWGEPYEYKTGGPDLRNRGMFDIYSTAGNSDQNQYIRN